MKKRLALNSDLPTLSVDDIGTHCGAYVATLGKDCDLIVWNGADYAGLPIYGAQCPECKLPRKTGELGNVITAYLQDGWQVHYYSTVLEALQDIVATAPKESD